MEGAEAEAEQAFKARGVEGLKAFVEKKTNAWKTTTVRIAVVGQSGAGKSSFINTIRGIEDDEDPLFAQVGEVETTMNPKSYQFPENEKITLWDLPGAGTKNFKAAEYAEKMKFSTYDAFVILSSVRFTEIDKMIADEIQKIGKPFFFARTKMDNVMTNEKRTKKKKFVASETSDQIREDCQKQLGKDSKIFLIANRSSTDLEEEFPEEKFPGIHFDNMDLTKEITEKLPEMQKSALVFLQRDLCSRTMEESEKMIAMKVEQLRARIGWMSAASAAGGAVPIVGVSSAIDIPLLMSELDFQRKQLQIDEATMQTHTKTFGPQFKVKLEAIVEMKNYLVGFTTDSIVKLATHIAKKIAVSKAAESVLKWIPFLGSIVGAGISAGVTHYQLTTALDAHNEIALKTMKVVAELRNARDIKSIEKL